MSCESEREIIFKKNAQDQDYDAPRKPTEDNHVHVGHNLDSSATDSQSDNDNDREGSSEDTNPGKTVGFCRTSRNGFESSLLKPRAFAIEVAVGSGRIPTWQVVQVQRGWDVKKLINHIIVLLDLESTMSVPAGTSFKIGSNVKAYVPRLHMAELVNVATQLEAYDKVVICLPSNHHKLVSNSTTLFSTREAFRTKRYQSYLEERNSKSVPIPNKILCVGADSFGQLGLGVGRSLYNRKSSLLFDRYSKDLENILEEQENLHTYTCPRLYSLSSLSGRRVVSVSCGEAHTCLVTLDGVLLSFGCSNNGRLGHGIDSSAAVFTPREVKLPEQAAVMKVACGKHFTCVIACEMQRQTKTTPLGEPDANPMIAGTLLFSFGKAGPWLGQGKVAPNGSGPLLDVWTPGLVCQVDQMYHAEDKITTNLKSGLYMDVSCGDAHTLLCTTTGDVYSFGMGSQGRLGHVVELHSEPEGQSAKTKVNILANSNKIVETKNSSDDSHSEHVSVIDSQGQNHVLFHFLTKSELDRLWKERRDEYVGVLVTKTDYEGLVNKKTTLPVDPLRRVTHFVSELVEIRENSREGETMDLIREKEQRKYLRDTTIKNICAKPYEPAGETNLSLEWIFIKPSFANVYTPKRIVALSGQNTRSISAGGAHSAVVTTEGKAFTFGDNTYGQCGHGPYLHTYPIPKELVSCKIFENSVKQMVCGNKHTVCTLEGENRSHMMYAFGKQGRDASQENVCRNLFLSHLEDGTEKDVIHTASMSYFTPVLISNSLEASESIVKMAASESLTIFSTITGSVYAAVPGTITIRRTNYNMDKSSGACKADNKRQLCEHSINTSTLRESCSTLDYDVSDFTFVKLCDDNEFVTDVGVGGGGLIMTNETFDDRKFDNTIYNDNSDKCADHPEIVLGDYMNTPSGGRATSDGFEENEYNTPPVGSGSRIFTPKSDIFHTPASRADGERDFQRGTANTGHLVVISSSYLDNLSIFSSLTDHSPKSSMSSFSSYSNYSFSHVPKLAKANSGKSNRDFCLALPHSWKKQEKEEGNNRNCVIF